MKFYVVKHMQHYLVDAKLSDSNKSYSMTLDFEKAIRFYTLKHASNVIQHLGFGEIYEVEVNEKKLESNQVSKWLFVKIMFSVDCWNMWFRNQINIAPFRIA